PFDRAMVQHRRDEGPASLYAPHDAIHLGRPAEPESEQLGPIDHEGHLGVQGTSEITVSGGVPQRLQPRMVWQPECRPIQRRLWPGDWSDEPAAKYPVGFEARLLSANTKLIQPRLVLKPLDDIRRYQTSEPWPSSPVGTCPVTPHHVPKP